VREGQDEHHKQISLSCSGRGLLFQALLSSSCCKQGDLGGVTCQRAPRLQGRGPWPEWLYLQQHTALAAAIHSGIDLHSGDGTAG